MAKVLAICGSLRAQSSNRAVLQAALLLAPMGMQITFYEGLDQLPHFNPDLDRDPPPQVVANLREQLRNVSGVMISSPEYAHGIVGTLKNALDWLVGSGEFVSKPVMLINASPRATITQASLREILTTMAANIIDVCDLTLPIMGSGLGAAGIVNEPKLAMELTRSLAAFADYL